MDYQLGFKVGGPGSHRYGAEPGQTVARVKAEAVILDRQSGLAFGLAEVDGDSARLTVAHGVRDGLAGDKEQVL